jgi:phosphoserine aminotransferase
MGTSHRREPVKRLVALIRQGLAELYGLPEGYEVVLGVGGATALWDAAAFSVIDRRSQHLVFGEFSGKFAAVASGAPHLAPPQIIESAPGTRPHPDPDSDADVYAFTHNETSTGVSMPIERPGNAEALVVVDGTSAAGAMLVEPGDVDVYYFSPQKAFGSDGGLWVALCSPAAVSRIERLSASERWIPPFLDLGIALENSRKNQTYNTPALATLFLMARQIEWILEMGGLKWAAQRSEHTSGMVYSWAETVSYASPFVAAPEDRSPTVATIDLIDGVSASVVSRVLRAHGIVDTEGYRKLDRNQVRIATFPNVVPDDVEKLLGAIDFIVERLGVDDV